VPRGWWGPRGNAGRSAAQGGPSAQQAVNKTAQIPARRRDVNYHGISILTVPGALAKAAAANF